MHASTYKNTGDERLEMRRDRVHDGLGNNGSEMTYETIASTCKDRIMILHSARDVRLK